MYPTGHQYSLHKHEVLKLVQKITSLRVNTEW